VPPLPRKLYGRARSALVKERVKRGNASLADIIAIGQADAAIGEMRLLDLLASMPGMDKIQSKNVMEELGISDSCRLRRLDPTQRSALIRAFAERQLLETANQAGTPDTTERAATGTVDSANRSGDAAKPGQAPREPLFLQPTDSSPGVTRGWPCEYYRPDSPNGAYCLRPPIGRTPTETTPRGFAIDPRGRFLLSAGLDSHHLTVFRVRPDGALDPVKRHPMGKQPNWIEFADLR